MLFIYIPGLKQQLAIELKLLEWFISIKVVYRKHLKLFFNYSTYFENIIINIIIINTLFISKSQFSNIFILHKRIVESISSVSYRQVC